MKESWTKFNLREKNTVPVHREKYWVIYNHTETSETYSGYIRKDYNKRMSLCVADNEHFRCIGEDGRRIDYEDVLLVSHVKPPKWPSAEEINGAVK